MVEHVISQEPLGREGTQPSLTVFVVRVDSGEMQVMSGWPRSPGSLVRGSWLWTVPGERAAGGLLEQLHTRLLGILRGPGSTAYFPASVLELVGPLLSYS